ncbi:PorT family protein [Olleya sp. AH-315-K02]|nr:PorT family protein [Olleya sp. AH-315-K02]
MKKLLLIIAVFALVFNANAQETKFGVKAGVNFATIAGDETNDVKSKTAFHVGAVVEIPISDSFSVQPELIYSSQGAKGDDNNSDVELKLDYINLPIMAKFYVSEGFSLEAGPQVGFLMSSKIEESGESEDLKNETSGIDFGLNLGLGFKTETGLNFGARYNLGLSNIWDFEGSDNFKNQNSALQIFIGFTF